MSADSAGRARDFRQGFRTGAPLWLAAAPFALAFVVSARDAGLTVPETQWMSLVFNAAATQLAVVQQLSQGATFLALLLTTLAMNLHHFFYGVTLQRLLHPTPAQRPLLAFGLTDFVNGIALSRRGVSFSFVLGLESSIYLAWNVNTAIAIFLGAWLDSLGALRLGFIAPLTFFLLLLGVTRSRIDVVVAIASATIALLFQALGWSAYTLPVVAIAGSALGLLLLQRSRSGGGQP